MTWLLALRRPRLVPNPSSDVVVSLTSFPPRIRGLWATLDTLLDQEAPVKAVVLWLSDEEFPDRSIPTSLKRRLHRGLTLEWIPADRRSFDKLLPAFERYPQDRIICVDDDKLYRRDMVTQLLEVSDREPDAIVGQSGRLWSNAGTSDAGMGPILLSKTVSPMLYLLNGTGVLYPSGAIPAGALDPALISSLCPTDDDIWFWAASISADVRRVCLGNPKPRPNLWQESTPSLITENKVLRGASMRAAFEHFGLADVLAPPSGAPA